MSIIEEGIGEIYQRKAEATGALDDLVTEALKSPYPRFTSPRPSSNGPSLIQKFVCFLKS